MNITQQIAKLTDRLEAISNRAIDEGRALNADERELVDGITEQIASYEALGKAHRESAAVKAQAVFDSRENKAPAIPSPSSSLKAFSDKQTAYDFGQFVRATLQGNPQALQHCRDRGLIRGAMTTGDNTKGGFLVPEPIMDTVVALRERFGVMRRNAKNMPMSDAVQLIPKVAGEVTAYYVGEGDPVNSRNSITASDMALQQIKLEARKLATLTVVSSELSEDSVVQIADMLAESIAYSFALAEDKAGFLGDGSSTYGGIVGLQSALQAGSVVTATSKLTFADLTMANFEACIGKAKLWAGSNPKWYISQQGWANSMQRLMDAYSGNTLVNLAEGAVKTFLGFPVEISQVLESRTTGTTGSYACYFGDLSQGVYLGTRRGVNIQVDQSLYFNYDALAVRSTERFDIVCHDRGDATNAGGIIALVFG